MPKHPLKVDQALYKRIHAGVDASEQCRPALAHAIGLAKAQGAELRIVHVIDMGWMSLAPELGLDIERLAAARRADGQRILDAAKRTADAGGVTAEARLVETGTPAQRIATAIVDEAAAWPADVVVLGSRGHGAIEQWLLGSVAEGVARRSTIPLILVP